MPLSKRARIEIYLPVKSRFHKRLQRAIENEFLNTFGGCTVIRNIKGLYLASDDKPDTDGIDLIYADTPFEFESNRAEIEAYTDLLRQSVLESTSEESALVVVHEIYHSL